MDKLLQNQLLEFFAEYVTDHKKELIEQVLSHRTRHLTVVLEDIYESQNASAVLRTCDCFGIQDLHIIENKNTYTLNPQVVQGASKWVDLIPYNSTKVNNSIRCVNSLKSNGYKIYATSPDSSGKSINEVNISDKVALFFGTEYDGLTQEVIDKADELVQIPMYGFTESFNLSVSAAVCLNILTSKLFTSEVSWQLSEEEKKTMRLDWYKKIVERSALMEQEFIKRLK